MQAGPHRRRAELGEGLPVRDGVEFGLRRYRANTRRTFRGCVVRLFRPLVDQTLQELRRLSAQGYAVLLNHARPRLGVITATRVGDGSGRRH